MVHDPTAYDNFEWYHHGKRVKAEVQIAFGWSGSIYEMTVTQANKEMFDKMMAQLVECATNTGLKVPPLPKALVEEFPPTPEIAADDTDLDPAMMLNLAVDNRKPAVPTFAPANANQGDRPLKKADRPVPKGDDIPLSFWVTPVGSDAQTVKAYAQMRKEIYAAAGEKPQRGYMPERVTQVAYEWARQNPDRVRALIRRG